MLKELPVHMLWVSGELSRLARLSLASFLSRGYTVVLWSYEPERLEDSGADTRNAADIVPEFRDCADNMAYLSSLFRYRILAKEGGIWSDMDVVALADNPAVEARPLVASEKRRPFRHNEPTATGESLTQVTNCFMAAPAARKDGLWQKAAAHVGSLAPEHRTWENVGPHLLAKLMLEDPAHGIDILAPELVSPVGWWNVPAYFLEERDAPPSPFLHMYNTVWARRGVDAEQAFPPSSLAGRLWRNCGL